MSAENLLVLLIVAAFWFFFSVIPNSIDKTSIQSKSDTEGVEKESESESKPDTKIHDEYEAALDKQVKEFEQQHLAPRVRYLAELNAEIAKYSDSNSTSANPESSQLPQQLETRLKKHAHDMWRKHQKTQDERKAARVKQERINEFKSREQALLDERSKLLIDIDSLAAEKEKIVDETKTYIAMMEKLNER